MTSHAQTFLQAASDLLPTVAPIYDSLMRFEECQGWAAMQMLAYREHLSDEDAASLKHLMEDMVESLELELKDGGYGGGFVGDLESSMDGLEEVLQQWKD